MSHQRPYRGLSAQERISERRERLLTSALDLFGTRGYAATTIEQLCASAKVSTRAFYECFDSRDDLLVALHNRIVDGARTAIVDAVAEVGDSLHDQVRARLSACVRYMTEDPRRIRISHIELLNLRDPFSAYRRSTVHDLVQLVPTESLPEGEDSRVDRTHVAIALLGAIDELLIDWVQSSERESPETLLATIEYLFLAALSGGGSPASEMPVEVSIPDNGSATAAGADTRQ